MKYEALEILRQRANSSECAVLAGYLLEALSRLDALEERLSLAESRQRMHAVQPHGGPKGKVER